MKSLCHALEGRVDTSSLHELEFDMERELERQAEEKLEKDAVAEIDRYRRMDEWSSSFQNIFSRTALHCQLRLMQAKIMESDLMHFLQYTRSGTFDLLRLEAFECLVELDIFRSSELLRWFIYIMSSDPSPLMRHRLHQLFGKALAPVAFGTDQVSEQPSQSDGLIIEQESSTEVRRADLARKQTVPGALEALKKELSGNAVLKESLWAACNSSYLGALEVSDFGDLCRILYDPRTSVLVKLTYPRYWKVQHLGNVSNHTFVLAREAQMTNSPAGQNAFLQVKSDPHVSFFLERFQRCCREQTQTRRPKHGAPSAKNHFQILQVGL
jgi:transcription initiation factor TFIID subunit 2